MIPEWLVELAKNGTFPLNVADLDNEFHEILKIFGQDADSIVDDYSRYRCIMLLKKRQRDIDYLSSLDLHKVIAKHVRASCRMAQAEETIESWVSLHPSSANLIGLAEEIAYVIRAAWSVPTKIGVGAPKFSNQLSLNNIDHLHHGLENLIGYPPVHADFLTSMKQEHDQVPFVRQKRTLDPKIEWNIVMQSKTWNFLGINDQPIIEISGRECMEPLEFYVNKAREKFANAEAVDFLNEAEVAALRLWTGPMHETYADLFRNPQKPNGPYVTTLHAINSGITKLARIWPLPASRKVYRGYKNLMMQDLKKDAFNCVGGVANCMLSTSEDYNIAADYSAGHAIILEIDVGQGNRGADVSWLSQFPHEREILFNALCNVEFVNGPQTRIFHCKYRGPWKAQVFQVRVSVNVTSKTLDQFLRMQEKLNPTFSEGPEELNPKFSDGLSFEGIEHHLSLENLIGYPLFNAGFLQSMKLEHENGKTFTDYMGRTVDPKVEWNVVMMSEKWNIVGAGYKPTPKIKNRVCGESLGFYVQRFKDEFAETGACISNFDSLNEAEIAALRLWTGPMYTKYAGLLRDTQKPNCPYVTTLHAISSGITKLARISRLPASRKVYRGYDGRKMQDLSKDAFQCVGGVEKCVLAATEHFSIAAKYSGDGTFILEIDVGQVNRGADVSWLSQFPHEREILFNVLSHIEVVGRPQERCVEGHGVVVVYQVCISTAQSRTLEEFVKLRKDLHLQLVDVVTQEVQKMTYIWEEGCRHDLIKSLASECRNQCDDMLREAKAADVSIFNQGSPAYVRLVTAAIMLPSKSMEIMDQVLHCIKTQQEDPAAADQLQCWQLEAIRAAFIALEAKPSLGLSTTMSSSGM